MTRVDLVGLGLSLKDGTDQTRHSFFESDTRRVSELRIAHADHAWTSKPELEETDSLESHRPSRPLVRGVPRHLTQVELVRAIPQDQALTHVLDAFRLGSFYDQLQEGSGTRSE